MAKTATALERARTDLAGEVAPKLEAARAQLAVIERRIEETALAAALNEMGAAGRLSQLNGDRDLAAREVAQLEGAHRLAIQRDAIARAAVEAKARQTQLADLQQRADARLEAMTAVCDAIETAARAYTRFLDATGELARAMPTGVIQHSVDWSKLDVMVNDRTFPAAIDVVVGAEMFRHADPRRAGSPAGALPGARPPVEQLRLQPDLIEPATEAVKRMNAYLVGLVKDKFESVEQADAVRFAKSA